MTQLILSVVVAVTLTAAAATVMRHAPSTGHTVGVVSSKPPESCRRHHDADGGV